MFAITEADRATARRVIRRHAGVHERATVRTTMDPRRGFCEVMRGGARVVLGYGHWREIVKAAAAGRTYAAALRGAK